MLAHKIRLNPTAEQEADLWTAAHNARFVYNWGLARWDELHQAAQKPNRYGLQKELNHIKREQFPWLMDNSKSVAQYALMDLQKAFKNFFEGRAKRPKFESRKRAKPAFGLDNLCVKADGHWIKMARIDGWINMTEVLRFDGKIMSARVSYHAGHWWCSVTVNTKDQPRENNGPTVGFDLDVKGLIVTSDGEVIENQANLRKCLKKLRKLNQALARSVKGSKRWLKCKAKIAKLHFRIACLRNDYQHKATTYLTKTYSLIGLKDLNVSGMVKNRRLALSISDAALGELRRQFEYKAEKFGGFVQKIGRFFPSSKVHHECGWKNEGLTLSDRVWVCGGCGASVHRDLNAALNIRDEAIRLTTA